jgi:hypothetical protein
VRQAQRGFEHATMGQAFAAPGMDTRQWVSNGLVDAGTPDNGSPPVAFDDELGPLVNVTLQPSGIPVTCRVAGPLGGNGEASFRPFVEGDEVLVLLPQGDERDNPIIIGRLNNAIDLWPTQVGGMDATKNNVSFDRLTSPYVMETASSWMVRNAATNAFVGLYADGKILMTNADKAFLALNPDFLGMQSGDGALILQVDLHARSVLLQADTARLEVNKDLSSFVSQAGSVALAGYGASPTDHCGTVEGGINLLEQALVVLGAAIAALGPAPLTGAALGAILTKPLVQQLLVAAIAASTGGTVTPYKAAIAAALAAKPGDPSGVFPNLGCAGVNVG